MRLPRREPAHYPWNHLFSLFILYLFCFVVFTYEATGLVLEFGARLLFLETEKLFLS